MTEQDWLGVRNYAKLIIRRLENAVLDELADAGIRGEGIEETIFRLLKKHVERLALEDF